MIVKVERQACFAVPKEPIVSGTVGIRYAEFEFSEDWKGLDAMAVFQTTFGVGRVMEIIDNKCEIPWEVMEKAGNIKVGIIGVKGDTRYPTIWSQPIPVIQGAVANGGKSGTYTKSFLEATLEQGRRIVAQAKEYFERIIQAIGQGYVTPESYGAKGDGITNDTAAFQEALDSGRPVLAQGNYLVSSIQVYNNDLKIAGTITGQVVINNQATVTGGTIKQTSTDPAVKFESRLSDGQGYMNSYLSNCNIEPGAGGVGIQLYADSNALFGVYVRDVDILSTEKSIYIYNNKWITKCDFENIYCHTPTYVIYVENLKSTNTYCADFTFRNVYAQHYNQKPVDFFHLETGNCLAMLQDSFSYDGVESYHYYLDTSATNTRLTLLGALHADPTAGKFTNWASLRPFFFDTRYTNGPHYIMAAARAALPASYYGVASIEDFNTPSLPSSRFSGIIQRGGRVSGASEPNKVYGVSAYDGRLSVLRSTDGTISSGTVVEVSTPYSGGVYTTSTLPTSVRDGAECWCSDIKMKVTYYSGTWYKPDGMALS